MSVHVVICADNVVGNLVRYLLGMRKIVVALDMFIGSVQVPGTFFVLLPLGYWCDVDDEH